MSEEKPNRNIFLNKSDNRFSRSLDDNIDINTTRAKQWLEKNKPTLRKINKKTLETTIPNFVQDYIYRIWTRKCVNENDEFEKPEEIKPIQNISRWNQIRSELTEYEEKKNQENSFRQERDYNSRSSSRSSSRFRPNSYKSKPKKKPQFDLAKETEHDGFPDLN
jgi:hypothetical protein